MPLFLARIKYTRPIADVDTKPPKDQTFAVRAKDTTQAISKSCKYARKFWPDFVFEVEQLSRNRVLE